MNVLENIFMELFDDLEETVTSLPCIHGHHRLVLKKKIISLIMTCSFVFPELRDKFEDI